MKHSIIDITKKMKQQLKKQRIEDLYALIGRHRITLTDLCKVADLPYDSVRVNMRLTNQGVKAISTTRLDKLEEAALKLREEKLKETA